MRLVFNCFDKCKSNDAEIMDSSSWTPSHIQSEFKVNNLKEGGGSSPSNIVSAQPTTARVANIADLAADANSNADMKTEIVNMDFRISTVQNDDRFTDMAATIFKRNS